MQWRRDDGYELDTEPKRLNVAQVHDWISNDSYWAAGRSRETMDRAIDGSLCFGAYAPDGRQVAFARIVTDYATFAWLCDVYVGREARGLGIGTWLALSVREHMLALGVRRIVLATADAHGVYAKAGFTPFARPDRWMEIDIRATSTLDDIQRRAIDGVNREAAADVDREAADDTGSTAPGDVQHT